MLCIVVGFILELNIGIRKIYAEPVFDVHRYRVLQDISGYQSNAPFYPLHVNDKDSKPGFHPRIGLSDQQKAELSWLAANAEPVQRIAEPPRARPVWLTTEQPSITPTRIYYRRYSGTPVNRTRQPNYVPNFQTVPPAYYGGYALQGFIPEGYVPVSTMVSAINKILSVVQKTVQPGSIGSASANGAGIWEARNSISSGGQQPQPPLPVIPGNGEEEVEELVEVEQVKGTPIRKAEEVEKPIDPSSFGKMIIISGGDGDNSGGQGTSIAIPLTTTPPAVDDGSNLLDSLLHGRLDKVDWFGSLLGTNKLPSKEEGNAVAQIFQGGIFGPAS